MAKHAVIRKDRLYGTDVAPALVSMRFVDGNGNGADIDNGNVVRLDGLMTHTDGTGAIVSIERELYKAVAPAANTALKDIAIVGTNEVMYDERKKNLDEFYNEAGQNSLGYRPHAGDMFGVTAEGLTAAAAIAKGDIVELQAGTKLKVVKSATSGSTQVGVIADINKAGRYTYYVVEVK